MTPRHPTVTSASAPLDGFPLAGRYELDEVIGEGGMGVVCRARDTALDREVAVKLLKPGVSADSSTAARFLGEARVTGQLQHPSIPPVHDLGTLADGRPFLAMKLVNGQTLRELLRLREGPAAELGRFVAAFEQICHAVGYAHARQVIHRDLKPANIMVGAHGEVQVMDWGLAKVLSQGPTPERANDGGRSAVPERVDDGDPDATTGLQTEVGTPEPGGSATRTGSVLGTPAYMPPEQAAGKVRELDARSDVFGLGAILCEILTGHPPYVGKTNNDRRVQAVRGDLQDALARLDACAAEPGLVALCKRCLAVRQEDRPADGTAVAAEVARIRQAAEARARQAELEGERAAVRAAEQSRRRRLTLGAAAAVTAALVAGLAVSLWQMREAKQERDAKAEALIAEQKAKEEAERRLAQIEKGVELFAGMLSGINPRAEEKGGEPLYVQLRQKAEKAAAELEGEAVGDPLAVARLQSILGDTLRGLGSYTMAVAVLEKAQATRERELGPDHPDTLTTLNNLAGAYWAAGRLSEAIKLYEQVRDARVAKLGADHPDTLTTLNNLALAYRDHGRLPEAVKLYEQVRDAQMAKLGADHPDTLTILHNLALTYRSAGRLPEAVKLFEQVRDARVAKLGADHPHTLTTLTNLAGAYQDDGKLPEAIKLFEQIRDARVAKLGADHPSTLTTLNNLALTYRDAGRLPEAIKLFEQVRDVRVAKLGADHPHTLFTLDNLAGAYWFAGRPPEAVKLFEQVRDARVAKLGADHPDTLTTLNNLALAYRSVGRLPEAVKLFEQVRDAQMAKLGADHPSTLTTLHNLALAFRSAGRLPEAIKLFEQVRDVRVAKLGADHPHTLTTLHNLALTYRDAGRLPEAIKLYEQAAQGIAARDFLHEHAGGIIPDTVRTYEQAKQFDRAEVWQRRWLAHVKEKTGPESPAHAGELAGLGVLLLKQEKWAEAEAVLRECLALRRKAQPEAWTTFNAESLLGGAMLGQKKYAEAEPLLLAGYEGMKDREKAIPPQGRVRVPEALDRLVELYTATDKPDEAKKWRTERAKYPAPVEKGPAPREKK